MVFSFVRLRAILLMHAAKILKPQNMVVQSIIVFHTSKYLGRRGLRKNMKMKHVLRLSIYRQVG